MSTKNRGRLPLCWQVRTDRCGQCATVHGPMTRTAAQRVARLAESLGRNAVVEEIEEATARHRAIINARRSA